MKMQIQKQIETAETIIERLSKRQRAPLRALCRDIREAQSALNRAAEPLFRHCLQRCRGLCCRNIHVNEIVTLMDYLFILASDTALSDPLRDCARKESLFSADCLFLRDGVGPCLFAADMKPERCIITFCDDTGPIRQEIKAVRKGFTALQRYILIRRPLAAWFFS